MLFHPCIDGGIVLDSSVESQKLRSHSHAIFRFRIYITRHRYTRNERDKSRETPISSLGRSYLIEKSPSAPFVVGKARILREPVSYMGQ
jgi:hypothetical protein